jgi:hypothetical protein
MAPTIPDRVAGVQPKMLAAGIEPERKRLAEHEGRRRVGTLIDRALALARMTKQELSYAMGYQDQSAVSRWISGVERPLLDKLFAVDRFYDGWVIACAEANPRIAVTTTITIQQVGLTVG